MKQSILLAYQWFTGLSDTGTGALLYLAPAFTLRIIGVHTPGGAAPYIAWIGAFVLSMGFTCLYGVHVIVRNAPSARLEMIWLVTAFFRSAVAIYLVKCILTGEFQPPWIGVALFSGTCAVIQGVGLRQRWIEHAH